MADLHALLDECQAHCQSLVEELAALKQSRILHDRATEALEATSAALVETARQIGPFREVSQKRFQVALIVGTSLNLLLLVVLVLATLMGS